MKRLKEPIIIISGVRGAVRRSQIRSTVSTDGRALSVSWAIQDDRLKAFLPVRLCDANWNTAQLNDDIRAALDARGRRIPQSAQRPKTKAAAVPALPEDDDNYELLSGSIFTSRKSMLLRKLLRSN